MATGKEVKLRKRRSKAKARKVRRAYRPAAPHPDCRLCERGHVDPLMVSLLEAHQTRSRRAREQAIRELLQTSGTGISYEEYRAHSARHYGPQPTPRSSVVIKQLDSVDQVMRNPRRQRIVEFIAHARLVSPEQIAQLFWPDASQISDGARRLAQRELREVLVPHHIVYRVWLGNFIPGRQREVYGLGFAGAEWMSRQTHEGWDWITGPGDIGYNTVSHDLDLNDLFIAFRKSEGEIELDGRPVTATLALNNYYTASHLAVAAQGSHREQPRHWVGPDAFCAVGIDLHQPVSGLPNSFLLPFLIENDTGSRDAVVVADQLMAYLPLAESRAILRRFPELNIEGYDPAAFSGALTNEQRQQMSNPNYAVPLVMSFDQTRRNEGQSDEQKMSEFKAQGRRRARNIFGQVSERALAEGYQVRPPIFGALKRDLEKKWLQAPSFDIWADDAQWENPKSNAVPLLERVVAANFPLIRTGGLSSSSVLEIDPGAAAWRKPARSVKGAPKKKTAAEVQREIAENARQARAAGAAQGNAAIALPGGEVR